MRGLIACFAIACLSLAGGNPTNEESKTHSKYFDYENNDVIYSIKPFFKDEIVYAVCEGSDADKKCKVYVDSMNEDKSTVQSCDLNLNYNRSFDFDISLFNAGNSKAVFAVRDGETKLKLISVNLKGCHIKEAVMDWKEQTIQHPSSLDINFVPHENNYEVVFENKELCHEFYCKVTLDYEGNVVKPASKFIARHDTYFSHLQIETTDKGYLVSQNDFQVDIYSVQGEDATPNLLFKGPRGQYVVGLSTAENKLGYCVQVDPIKQDKRTLKCRQYDAEGKTRKLDFEISSDKERLRYIEIYNLEKGLLALTAEEQPDSRKITKCSPALSKFFVVHFDEHGKQVKKLEIDIKCEAQHAAFPKLYKNSNGQFCVSHICLAGFDCKENKFSRHNRCFFESELF